MTIPKETKDRLLRMAGIEALMSASGYEDVEELTAEYRELLTMTVDEFLPLVQLLVAAGAITLHVQKEALSEAKKFEDSYFHATEAWNNGNIWIVSDEWSGGSPAGQKQPEAQPNGLN